MHTIHAYVSTCAHGAISPTWGPHSLAHACVSPFVFRDSDQVVAVSVVPRTRQRVRGTLRARGNKVLWFPPRGIVPPACCSFIYSWNAISLLGFLHRDSFRVIADRWCSFLLVPEIISTQFIDLNSFGDWCLLPYDGYYSQSIRYQSMLSLSRAMLLESSFWGNEQRSQRYSQDFERALRKRTTVRIISR